MKSVKGGGGADRGKGWGLHIIHRVTLRILINRIIKYSAMKISANGPALYSILNPETSSDSPSAKSKGVRFVSASMMASHMRNRGVREVSLASCECEISRRSNVWCRVRGEIIIRAIVTSYEIVCATPRIAPSRAYFELENHPAAKMVYTLILEMHRKRSMPRVWCCR